MNAQKRNLSFDIIRIVAALMVVMIHVSGQYLESFSLGSYGYTVGNVFNTLSRAAVPLFVMVSGALMLDENKSITLERILKKNVKSIAIVLVCWSALYAVIKTVLPVVTEGAELNIVETLAAFLLGHYHLWYLYMAIGLYVATPFLRYFVKKENKKLVLVFIVISLAFRFTLPVISQLAELKSEFRIFSSFLEKFSLGFFAEFVTYYLTGWYIVHAGFGKKSRKNILMLAGVLSVAVTFLCAQIIGDYSNAHNSFNIFVYLYSVAWFVFVTGIETSDNGGKPSAMLKKLSSLTFGVYVMHPMIMDIAQKIIPFESFDVAGSIISEFSVIALTSFALCYVISKIPYVNKIIRA